MESCDVNSIAQGTEGYIILVLQQYKWNRIVT